MREVRTEINIDASPDAVWQILSDFEAWEEWNPLLSEFRAGTAPGSAVSFKIELGGRALPIKARMLRFDTGREICWRGPPSAALGLLFNGEHWLILRATPEGKTRFLHGERFDGALVPLLWGRLEPEIRRGYIAMNQALKDQVESKLESKVESKVESKL